jgi:hypothetical protein
MMAGAWTILRRMGEKKVGELKDTFQKYGSEKIGKDFPLGLRFNCIVEIPEVDFILAGKDLKIQHPGTSLIVRSYGTFAVSNSKVHRFYFEWSSRVYMLQVVADSNQVVEECKFFMSFDEVYPEDWDFWLAERDGYIGLSIFQTKDGVQYDRVWQDSEAEIHLDQDASGNGLTRIRPVQFLETVYSDPYGEVTETVKCDSMLYGRNVNENVDEYLLLSAVNEREGASIQIMVGLELEPASIKVI